MLDFSLRHQFLGPVHGMAGHPDLGYRHPADRHRIGAERLTVEAGLNSICAQQGYTDPG